MHDIKAPDSNTTSQINPGQPQILRRLVYGLVFGFVVVLGVALAGDVQQVGAAVLGFRWELLPLVLLLTLLNYTLRWVKWHYFIHQAAGESDCAAMVPRTTSIRLFVAGFPLAVTPGKVGEALKGVWLNQTCGLPVGRGVAIVLAERISDGLAVLLLSSLGVLAYPQYWPIFAAALGLMLGMVVVSQIRPLASGLLGIVARLPLIGRLALGLTEFYEGSSSVLRPAVLLVSVGLGTVSWLAEGIGLYLILLGLGVPASNAALGMAVFAMAFSMVAGALSALPGGLGAAEAVMAGILILALGLPGEIAAAAALLIRFATLWFGVSLGLLVWWWARAELFGQAPTESETPV